MVLRQLFMRMFVLATALCIVSPHACFSASAQPQKENLSNYLWKKIRDDSDSITYNTKKSPAILGALQRILIDSPSEKVLTQVNVILSLDSSMKSEKETVLTRLSQLYSPQEKNNFSSVSVYDKHMDSTSMGSALYRPLSHFKYAHHFLSSLALNWKDPLLPEIVNWYIKAYSSTDPSESKVSEINEVIAIIAQAQEKSLLDGVHEYLVIRNFGYFRQNNFTTRALTYARHKNRTALKKIIKGYYSDEIFTKVVDFLTTDDEALCEKRNSILETWIDTIPAKLDKQSITALEAMNREQLDRVHNGITSNAELFKTKERGKDAIKNFIMCLEDKEFEFKGLQYPDLFQVKLARIDASQEEIELATLGKKHLKDLPPQQVLACTKDVFEFAFTQNKASVEAFKYLALLQKNNSAEYGAKVESIKSLMTDKSDTAKLDLLWATTKNQLSASIERFSEILSQNRYPDTPYRKGQIYNLVDAGISIDKAAEALHTLWESGKTFETISPLEKAQLLKPLGKNLNDLKYHKKYDAVAEQMANDDLSQEQIDIIANVVNQMKDKHLSDTDYFTSVEKYAMVRNLVQAFPQYKNALSQIELTQEYKDKLNDTANLIYMLISGISPGESGGLVDRFYARLIGLPRGLHVKYHIPLEKTLDATRTLLEKVDQEKRKSLLLPTYDFFFPARSRRLRHNQNNPEFRRTKDKVSAFFTTQAQKVASNFDEALQETLKEFPLTTPAPTQAPAGGPTHTSTPAISALPPTAPTTSGSGDVGGSAVVDQGDDGAAGPQPISAQTQATGNAPVSSDHSVSPSTPLLQAQGTTGTSPGRRSSATGASGQVQEALDTPGSESGAGSTSAGIGSAAGAGSGTSQENGATQAKKLSGAYKGLQAAGIVGLLGTLYKWNEQRRKAAALKKQERAAEAIIMQLIEQAHLAEQIDKNRDLYSQLAEIAEQHKEEQERAHLVQEILRYQELHKRAHAARKARRGWLAGMGAAGLGNAALFLGRRHI